MVGRRHDEATTTASIAHGRFVVCAGRVATCAEGVGVGEAGAIDDGAVLVEQGRIARVGPRGEVLAEAGDAPVLVDAPTGLVTPGLIDAHTHAAWVGSRHDEYATRLAGGDYEAIARAGGGIKATMRAVATASRDDIAQTLSARLARMARVGVTTCEVKSGYGLDEAGERKQLEAIAQVAAEAAGRGLPQISATYLALHAVPPSWLDRREAYVTAVADRWLPAIAAAGLCRDVDAYVDRAAFTVDEARRVFARAAALGLGVRLHAGQFADVGGAELAAQFSARSADHLEQVGPSGIDALASRRVAAVLLPVASFTLGQAPPPVAALRSAGVRLVVASDANPGTAPTESLPLAMALAARLYGLTPEACLLGATREAAHALGLGGETGQLVAGRRADLVVWGLPHERALAQPWGAPPVIRVLSRGNTLFAA